MEKDQFHVVEMSAKYDTLYRKFGNLYQSYNLLKIYQCTKVPALVGFYSFEERSTNNKHNHSILECDVLCKKRRDPGTVDWERQDISCNLIGSYGRLHLGGVI